MASVLLGVDRWRSTGLSSSQRTVVETAYKSGVVRVLCATSTLAVGVNLPVHRVILRSPKVTFNNDIVFMQQTREELFKDG